MDVEDTQEDEITLQEALETQEMLEKQSVAVLGASDPQNCSYSKGYMKRQALYACLTCNPKGAPFSQAAGVCLACSYNCHEGHDLVELFTKRLFRCDCGNKKFPDNKCRLEPNKDELNDNNTYNQNFNGLYCSCHRPYPDPNSDNDTADDSMIQCIVCEDWFHFQHCLSYLNMDFDSMDDFELMCGPCVSKLDFLGHYSHLALKPIEKAIVENDVGVNASVRNESADSDTVAKSESDMKSKSSDQVDMSSRDSGIDSVCTSDSSDESTTCLLQKFPKPVQQFSDVQAVAWKGSLRSSLCKCTDCLKLYQDCKIQYLVDTEDTIEHYEAIGKKFTEDAQLSAEASINNQVNNLGRVGQIEFIHGYNQFKEQLLEFLKSHADSGKVVQREDVNKFFAKVNEEQAAKRRRLE